MSTTRFEITLDWAEMIAPKVRHLAFTITEGILPPYINGQFISLHFGQGSDEFKRSYSIATRRDRSTHLELAASMVEGGRASDLLFHLQPGGRLIASGPYGRLTLVDPLPKRVILVATGTGVTPYRAMLQDLAHQMKDEGLQVVLLFGVQYRNQLLYGEEFLDFAKDHPQFEFRAHFSREQLTKHLPHEYPGYVQSAFATLHLNPVDDRVYLCGNPNMIDDAFIALKEFGFNNANVKREKYISGK